MVKYCDASGNQSPRLMSQALGKLSTAPRTTSLYQPLDPRTPPILDQAFRVNPQQPHMSTNSLQQLWDASANQPFAASVSKQSQFAVGFTLLFIAFILTGLFGLSESRVRSPVEGVCTDYFVDNKLASLPLYGIPASLAFG